MEIRNLLHQHWQPRPIDPPTVDPELKHLTGVQRSAEVIRYSILSVEYWLSPFGRLREWVRLNSKLCMILLIPGILVLPLVSWIIYLVAGWLSMLVGIAGNLIVLPLAILLAVGSLAISIIFLRLIIRK